MGQHLSSSNWLRALRCLLCCWLLSFKAQAFYIPPVLNSVSNTPRNQPVLHAKDDNKNPIASISSDGKVSGAPRPTGSLGKPSRKKKTAPDPSSKQKMSKKERQRTANGSIDSTSTNNGNSNIDPSEQGIQVVRGNRGTKTVSIIRGMTATSVDDKKKILKTLKSKLGVGGTLVDGVLELQGGDHVEKIVDLLKGMGYSKARKVGK